MKNLFILIVAVLSVSNLNGQINVPPVQKSMYGIFEATWCGNCGRYGIPITNQIINQTGNKAIFYTIHSSSSSDLYSSTAGSLGNALGVSAVPKWTLNWEVVNESISTIESSIVNSINSNYSATGADVNAGFEWRIENDTIHVETLTKFFNSLSGEFYVSLYLSEDSIWAYQSNYDPNIPSGHIYHNHILRTSFSANPFGLEVAEGYIDAGSTYSNFHKIKVDPNWNLDQIHLSAIVWQKNGTDYTFKNINDQGAKNISNSIAYKTKKENLSFNVYPNPNNGVLNIELNKLLNEPLIKIYNLQGALVYQGTIENTFTTQVDISHLKSGVYLVQLQSEKAIGSKRIIKQ
jgi:hypothetical protein